MAVSHQSESVAQVHVLLLGRFIIAHTSVKSISIDFGKLMSIAKEINKKKLEIANALAHSVR